ncbi:MAG TPA: cell division protein ZapA [Candidatus Mcinerneyibacteriales bacterium]|nr:cell division protein ZapA [Candidatus Mcinerneyibacteriales bacterium]
MSSLELDILGKKYKVSSDKGSGEITAMARFLEEKIDEARTSGGMESPKDILVLTLLTIIEEYWELKEEHRRIVQEIDEIEKTIERHL